MAKKLWGGRFKSEQDPLFWKFQASIGYDKVLAEYDAEGSIAHVKMLKKCNIIPAKAAQSLLTGLNRILNSIQKGTFAIDPEAEDIHTAIYTELSKKIGRYADYLHTARSRNDQVVLGLRMYSKDKLSHIVSLIKKLQAALVGFAKDNIDVIMPGLTHTQHAMPVLLSHQVLAYVTMLERDMERFKQARERCDEMPLGSCALAGTSFTIDRNYVAKLLGFSKVSSNSIDAVSDRDFVVDILSAAALLFMHLSRFSEDMILFSTPEFGFIDIGEAFCTGSSIMPQKKNPDSLELIRGYCSSSYANLISVLTMMKGLPLSYNRDMQLDKEPLFKSIDITEQALEILAKLIKAIKVDKALLEKKLGEDESLLAIDIADYLVKNKVAFSQAHKITGNIVAYALDNNLKISGMPLNKLKQFSEEFKADIFKIFDAKKSVLSKRSLGSTNPLLVKQEIDKWEKYIHRKV